jgi:hypothetical protein
MKRHRDFVVLVAVFAALPSCSNAGLEGKAAPSSNAGLEGKVAPKIALMEMDGAMTTVELRTKTLSSSSFPVQTITTPLWSPADSGISWMTSRRAIRSFWQSARPP